MPPANVDATIILLDVGKNVAGEDEKGPSFFKDAHACVTRIIERKIISRPKDLICIILMGSKKSRNNLAEQTGDFRHIEYLTTKKMDDDQEMVAIDTPKWDLLSKLPQKPTKYEADWFEGLIVAADALKNGLYGTKVTNKKIVLMTNFEAPAHFGDNFDKVVAGFQSEEFEVDVIGPNLDKNSSISEGVVETVSQLVEATNGVTATFEHAMRYLLFHRTKAVNPMPWNVDLCIGPNVKIPISAYGRIRDVKVVSAWQKAYRDPVTNSASLTEGVGRKKEYFRMEDHAPMDVDDTVTGYLYGKTVIPFSDTDKTMLYESGTRGLQIYGFTAAENIHWQNLAGDGVTYVFGRKGDSKAQKALLCLVSALKYSNLVGIARRVYNNGNAPTMFSLFPCVDNDGFVCLSMVALCYRDDIKGLSFPPINMKKFDPTDEEVEGFRQLIDSMDLMTACEGYDDEEAIPILQTVNPSLQYVLDCLAFRAVNPDIQLPPPRDDILTPFKLPELVEKRSKEPLKKLAKMLDLKEVERKHARQRSANATAVSVSVATNEQNNSSTASDFIDIKVSFDDEDDEVINIGTVNPVGDFEKLKASGKTLIILLKELTEVIENLVYLNFDGDYSKPTTVIKVLRQECVKCNPNLYNDWLSTFKQTLAERGKASVVELLQTESLNLIVKEENELSSVSRAQLEDNNPLYEVSTVPDSIMLSINPDIEAMFEDM